MTNERSRLFQSFLEREELNCFDVKELNDENNTVIFRAYIKTELGSMPAFVILDNSIYSIVRVTVGYGVVNGDNEGPLSVFLNQENAKYKSFKLYIDREDDSLYLDCVYMATEGKFEPELVYVLLQQLVEYIPEVHGEIVKLMGFVPEIKEAACDCGQEHHNH